MKTRKPELYPSKPKCQMHIPKRNGLDYVLPRFQHFATLWWEWWGGIALLQCYRPVRHFCRAVQELKFQWNILVSWYSFSAKSILAFQSCYPSAFCSLQFFTDSFATFRTFFSEDGKMHSMNPRDWGMTVAWRKCCWIFLNLAKTSSFFVDRGS